VAEHVNMILRHVPMCKQFRAGLDCDRGAEPSGSPSSSSAWRPALIRFSADAYGQAPLNLDSVGQVLPFPFHFLTATTR
jgi:hypothetical protein